MHLVRARPVELACEQDATDGLWLLGERRQRAHEPAVADRALPNVLGLRVSSEHDPRHRRELEGGIVDDALRRGGRRALPPDGADGELHGEVRRPAVRAGEGALPCRHSCRVSTELDADELLARRLARQRRTPGAGGAPEA
eukprot:scaffold8421_cov114-Isochrysis_galbana.AAC.1